MSAPESILTILPTLQMPEALQETVHKGEPQETDATDTKESPLPPLTEDREDSEVVETVPPLTDPSKSAEHIELQPHRPITRSMTRDAREQIGEVQMVG